MRQYFEQLRHHLNIDGVDVFFVEYVSPVDDMKQMQVILDELKSWQEKGLIAELAIRSFRKDSNQSLTQGKRI